VAGPGAPGSFTHLVPAWLSDLALRGYAEATRTTWSVAMGLFAAWAMERDLHDARQVTRAVMEAYQRHLYRQRSGRGRGPRGSGRSGGSAAGDGSSSGHPLAIRTQRSHLTAVDRFYAWAVKRGHVPANPAADLDLPRKPKTLPDHLTEAEAAGVLGLCEVGTPQGLRDRAILELLYSTGLRRLEALNLQVADLDLTRGIVHVIHGKGAKDRFCPLGQRAAGWLSRYLTEVRARWCRDPAQQRLFLDEDGQPSSSGALGGRLHRLLIAAGISKRGACHLFRHSFATGLVEGGCDIRLIAAMLGHSDLKTTMLYTQVGISQLIAAHRLCHPAERAAALVTGKDPAAPVAGQETAAKEEETA
jgi:integrase/recombinase XerD